MMLEDYRVGLVSLVIVIELSAWLEVIRYKFITLANKFFNLVSSAVIDRFISVTINYVVSLLQIFTSLAINVLDYSTLSISLVRNVNRFINRLVVFKWWRLLSNLSACYTVNQRRVAFLRCWRIFFPSWGTICLPLTVSNMPVNQVFRGSPLVVNCLRFRTSLAIWRCNVDGPGCRRLSLFISIRNILGAMLKVVVEVLMNRRIIVISRPSGKDIILSIVLIKDITLSFQFLDNFIWILGKADRFASLAILDFMCTINLLAGRFIIEVYLGLLPICFVYNSNVLTQVADVICRVKRVVRNRLAIDRWRKAGHFWNCDVARLGWVVFIVWILRGRLVLSWKGLGIRINNQIAKFFINILNVYRLRNVDAVNSNWFI